MKHSRSIAFESLETRQLLSTASHAPGHAARSLAGPVALSGTLTVDSKAGAATTIMNADGSTTTSMPVAGSLGSLGEVHGVWTESADAYGNYEGPDTILLHNPRGSITIAFNNTTAKPTSTGKHSPISYEHAQHAGDGTRAYAGASETGSIVVTSNAARTKIATLTILTTAS